MLSSIASIGEAGPAIVRLSGAGEYFPIESFYKAGDEIVRAFNLNKRPTRLYNAVLAYEKAGKPPARRLSRHTKQERYAFVEGPAVPKGAVVINFLAVIVGRDDDCVF